MEYAPITKKEYKELIELLQEQLDLLSKAKRSWWRKLYPGKLEELQRRRQAITEAVKERLARTTVDSDIDSMMDFAAKEKSDASRKSDRVPGDDSGQED